MNKKFTLLTIAGTMAIAGAAAIAFGSKNGLMIKAGDECANGDHIGNHYEAKDATCTEAGNVEFWACCECHHQYLTEPSGGTWTDAGELSSTLDSSHIAYVAPTGVHDYVYSVIDSTTTEGNVDIVKACGMCGELLDDTVYNTMVKKLGAEYVIEDLADSYKPWSKTSEGVYTSQSGHDGSSSYMKVNFTSSGAFAFDYDVSTESGWDKFYVGTTNMGTDIVKEISGTSTGSVTVDVVEGTSIWFRYTKDGSGQAGRDNVIVTIKPSNFSYTAMEYVVNGGNAIAPGFIENGRLVGEAPTPEKANAYFEGWHIDPECEHDYVDQTFTGNGKLYAEWSDPCIVTLNYNYTGAENGSLSYKKGSTTNVAAEKPERAGYYFLGWFLDAGCNTPYTDGAINANIEVYAKWIAEADAHALYGTYKGFKVYKSWSSASIVDSYAEATVGVDGAISLRTAWSSYSNTTISNYDATTGAITTADSRFAYYDADDKVLVISEVATMTGSSYIYVLVRDAESTSKMSGTGKYFNDGKLGFVSFKPGENTVNLFIDVDANKVVYDASFKKLDNSAIAIADMSSVANIMQVVVYEGSSVYKTFGAKTSSTLSTTLDKYFGNYEAADGEKLYVGAEGTAIFTKASASSTLNKFEEVSDGVVYAKYSSTYSMLLTIDKTNGTFSYANRYITVTLNLNYTGSENPTETWLYDVYTSISTATPERAGFVFDGWYTAAEGGTKITGTKALTEDTTFYAHWLEAFTVTCVLNNGEEDVVVPVADGQTGSYPTPTKENFYFDGWCTDSDCLVPFDTSTPITGNITIYAKWATPKPFAGYYTGFNLCTSTIGYSTNTPSTTYRGAIGGNGVGIADKFKDWEFTDAGNGLYSCTKNSSSATGSYAVASDGTYFVCTHYSGPNSDPVPTDNLFGVNTGSSYDNSVAYNICRIADRIWIVKTTVGDKSYIVLCDAIHDIFEVDITLTSDGVEIGYDDIYNSTTKFVSELTISKGSKNLVNCTYSSGNTMSVSLPVPDPVLEGSWTLSDGTHTGTLEITVEDLNAVTSKSVGVGTLTVGTDVYTVYLDNHFGNTYVIEVYSGGSAYITVVIDNNGDIVEASYLDDNYIYVFGYYEDDAAFTFTTFTKNS